MAMKEPVARLVVNLDVPDPQGAVNLDFGVEEIRTRIAVVEPRIDHLHGFSVSGVQPCNGEHLMLPYIM